LKQRRPLSLLQLAVHVGAWIPLLVLLVDAQTGNLSINPYQDVQRRTGNIALILLILSLACTPINTLFRKPAVLKLNRPLGLYAYMYAVIHLFNFLVLDYGLQFDLILLDIADKRYIFVGLAALILLSLLALTSFRWWMKRMGKNWKRLHRLVYVVNLLVVLHFAWASKGDFFRLQGEVLRPLLAFLVIAALLILRIPAVRRKFARGRRPVRPPVTSEENI
jgi:sulfoxide reductase heme-binding subunit YedZ